MRTRNCVVILLIVALAGPMAAVVAAGQDNSAKPPQTTQRAISGTRLASCIVRITADPAIVPLDPATVQGLLHSSGVAGNAVREVLHLDAVKTPPEAFIEMEWLNVSAPRPSPTVAPANEDAGMYAQQMMRELEKIYGRKYMKQMGTEGLATQDKQDQPLDAAEVFGGQSTDNSPARSAPDLAQRATIRLSIHLPEDVTPAAEEFLVAVIEHIETTLRHAYESHMGDLRDLLVETRGQYTDTVEMIEGEGETDAGVRIREQLDRTVDLSALNPDVPIAEAVEMLRKSVEPPLNIVVLWNDLTAFLSVEPSTPIKIGGMSTVRLGTALDLLVRGLPASDERPIWKIKGDAIAIGTAATLGEPFGPTGRPKVERDPRVLLVQKDGLTNRLQDLELSLAGQEARRRAISEQMLETQVLTQKKLAEDQVTKELENLVQFSAENLSNLRKQADAGRASGMDLGQATESLTRARIELAKRREELSKQVGGGQLEQFSSEMGRIGIDKAEKEAQRDILSKQLAQVQQQLAQASAFDLAEAKMRMAREALDIMARRVAELQMRIANAQQPAVTMIGAN